MAAALPVIAGESGLARYLAEIKRFPMLEPQEEYMLAKRWREHEDRDADRNRVNGHPTESRNDQDHDRDDEVKSQADPDEFPGNQFLIGAG